MRVAGGACAVGDIIQKSRCRRRISISYADDPAIEYLYRPVMDSAALWKRDFGADRFNPFDTLASDI